MYLFPYVGDKFSIFFACNFCLGSCIVRFTFLITIFLFLSNTLEICSSIQLLVRKRLIVLGVAVPFWWTRGLFKAKVSLPLRQTPLEYAIHWLTTQFFHSGHWEEGFLCPGWVLGIASSVPWAWFSPWPSVLSSHAFWSALSWRLEADPLRISGSLSLQRCPL